VGALEQILGASGAGLVILGVVYLLAANRHDRKGYVDEVTAANLRTEVAQKRADDLRAEIARLDAEYEAKLDAERDRRRAAEDRRDQQADEFAEQARGWRAEIERLTAELERQTGEIKKLRETVT
jgi:DNA anti-recombination protein RmuC